MIPSSATPARNEPRGCLNANDRPRASASAAACVVLLVAGACSSRSNTLVPEEPVSVLSFADFIADPENPSPGARVQGATPSSGEEAGQVLDPAAASLKESPADRASASSSASPPVLDISASPRTPTGGEGTAAASRPVVSSGVAARSSKTVIVESKVGQINGRPVLASEILEPVDGRLRALAQQAREPSAWRRQAAEIIAKQLISRIRDELVLAEAQSNLTSEQRQGLFFFLSRLQDNLISTQGGSAVQADEALRAQTGRSLEEEARDRLDRELIEFELRSRIAPRVNISWRQVRNEYDRQFEKYNPTPQARLTMIWVKAADQSAIDAVKPLIETGASEDFSKAASSEANLFRRDQQGVVSVKLESDISSTQFFSEPALDAAAKSLSPGGVSPAVNFRDYTAWIRFEEISRTPGTSLYDAQLEIEGSLRERRVAAETARYFERLFERGSFSDIESMTRLLLEIALERYQPAGTK